MKTWMTPIDIINLYVELLDKKKIKNNGSAHKRLRTLEKIDHEKNKHYTCK